MIWRWMGQNSHGCGRGRLWKRLCRHRCADRILTPHPLLFTQQHYSLSSNRHMCRVQDWLTSTLGSLSHTHFSPLHTLLLKGSSPLFLKIYISQSYFKNYPKSAHSENTDSSAGNSAGLKHPQSAENNPDRPGSDLFYCHSVSLHCHTKTIISFESWVVV